MMPMLDHAPLWLVLAASLWLSVASAALILAHRARRRVGLVEAWGARLSAMISSAPEPWMIIESGGAIHMAPLLAQWLGVDARLPSFAQLRGTADGACGFWPEDHMRLAHHLERLTQRGVAFAMPVRLCGAPRILLAQGRGLEDGGMILWFADQSETVEGMRTLMAARDAARASAQAFEALLARAPFAAWRRNAQMQLIWANAAYAQAVEVPDAAAAVAQSAELADSAQQHLPAAQAQRAVAQDQLLVREQILSIAGTRRHLLVCDVPLGEGEAGGFALDVSERVEAVAARDRIMRAQTQTLDRLSAGVAQFAPDRSLVFFNRAFATMFQLDIPWLSERPEFDRVFERMREVRRLPEQSDFSSWRRERRAWITDMLAPVEETWALPDNRIIRMIAQPHPSGGMLMIFEDRTEQLRLAGARETQLRVHEATLNNLHEAVAVFAADGCLELSNTRFIDLWGLDAQAARRRPHIDDLMRHVGDGPHKAMAANMRALVRDLAHDRMARHGRIEGARGRSFDYAAVPLPDGNALLTWMDVTDSLAIETALRDRNEALEAADRLKSAFVASMSYELRTPLTTISGFSEMLTQGYVGALTPAQNEYVAAIVSSTHRLRLLIDDVLDLATVEAGGFALDVHMIEPASLIARICSDMQARIEEAGLHLELDLAPTLGRIEADAQRLEQTLHHLLSNALRFTPAGGQIMVRAAPVGAEVLIEVRDNGIGIDADDQARVFERFAKGRNAPSGEGLGLGLSLVQQFIALHGGTVQLRSERHQGTIVSVRLPRRIPRGSGEHDGAQQR